MRLINMLIDHSIFSINKFKTNMRKIIYILTLLFVTLFSACEVEEGQSGYPKTLQGKIAYDDTESRLSQSICLLDLMTKVDYYAQAPDDEKEGIKNYFLSRYTITKTDKTWTLDDNTREITFTHNQKSINESGAVWTAKVITNAWEKGVIVFEDENFRVESSGDKDWKIIAANLKYYNILSGYSFWDDDMSNAELKVKGSKSYDKSPNLYDFKVESGKGNLKLNSANIHYEIVEPVSYIYMLSSFSNLYPISGKLDIIADNDRVVAQIIQSDYGSGSQIKITFKGLTETYY